MSCILITDPIRTLKYWIVWIAPLSNNGAIHNSMDQVFTIKMRHTIFDTPVVNSCFRPFIPSWPEAVWLEA